MYGSDVEILAIVTPLVAFIMLLAFILLMRYLSHKERMAMIERGMTPVTSASRPSTIRLQSGLIVAGVGLGLTIAMAGFNSQRLVLGFVPLCVGLALLVGYGWTQWEARQQRPHPGSNDPHHGA